MKRNHRLDKDLMQGDLKKRLRIFFGKIPFLASRWRKKGGGQWAKPQRNLKKHCSEGHVFAMGKKNPSIDEKEKEAIRYWEGGSVEEDDVGRQLVACVRGAIFSFLLLGGGKKDPIGRS